MIRTHVTPGFFLMLAIYYTLERSGLFWCIIPAIAVHELGHAFAICGRGGRITDITFSASGLRMDYQGQLSYMDDALIAVCGPCSNLLFAFLCALVYRLGKHIWIYAAGINLLFAVVNLLPAGGLDGGTILNATLYRFLSACCARKISYAVSAFFSVGILIFGLYIGVKTRYNISVLCLGVGLCVRAILSDKEKYK